MGGQGTGVEQFEYGSSYNYKKFHTWNKIVLRWLFVCEAFIVTAQITHTIYLQTLKTLPTLYIWHWN